MATLYTSLEDCLENAKMAHFTPVQSVPLEELCDAASVTTEDLRNLCAGKDEQQVGHFALNIRLICPISRHSGCLHLISHNQYLIKPFNALN